MGKWLAKFSPDIQESRTDIADIVPTLPALSALSVPHIEVSAKITPPDSADEPTPPLQAGWLVVYMDYQGKLAGGSDDPDTGTVEACRWDENGWTLCLTDGQEMPLSIIRSVGQTDAAGQIVAAWTVREHGYDGEGPG